MLVSGYPGFDIEELVEFLRPKIRLFLSADLVGSTALKQGGMFPLKKPSDDDTLGSIRGVWFGEISRFYKKFPILFHDKWQETRAVVKEKNPTYTIGEEPLFWKANGDELLYVKQIVSPQDLYLAIAVWRDSVEEYRIDLRERGIDLDIKASAWTAGFPLMNSEIILPIKDDIEIEFSLQGQKYKYKEMLKYLNDPIIGHFLHQHIWSDHDNKKDGCFVMDFVGPQIDAGFRIASRADKRKFTLSFEAACILANVLPHPFNGIREIRLRYDGRFNLKGVLKGKEYPVFWVDCMKDIDEVTKLEDKIFMDVKSDDFNRFSNEFVQSNNQLIIPFFTNYEYQGLNIIPENYKHIIEALNQKWAKEIHKITSERDEKDNDTSGQNSEEIPEGIVSLAEDRAKN